MYYWRRINIVLFVALVLLLIPAVVYLLMPGFFTTDDATWMVIRFSAFFDTLKDGQIPVRVLERLNNGYGYPVANFLYPGFMYIASIIHIVGFGFVDSIKVLLISSMMLSGIFSYFWLKKIFDPYAAFIGSLFYVYTPYHLYDLYTRGSVGEILAFTFVPFILWQIDRKSLPFTAIGIFLLIISHNSLAALLLPLILLYAIFTRSALVAIGGTLLGILMSAFFIVPAIFELPLTKFSQVTISNPFEYFAPIPLVGYSSALAILISLIVLIAFRKSFRFVPYKWLFIVFLIICLVSIFLSTQLSSPLWNIIPSRFIQFPYRILSLLVVGISFISAFVVSKAKGKYRIIIIIMFLGALSFSAMQFVRVKERTFYPDGYYTTNMDTTTVKDEYMPKWVKKKADKLPPTEFEVIKGNAQVKIVSSNSRDIELDLKNSTNSTIRINRIYYPGWEAYMNHERIDVGYNNEMGAMDINIERSGGRLTLIFEETPLRYISDTISVVAALFMIFLLLRPILKFK